MQWFRAEAELFIVDCGRLALGVGVVGVGERVEVSLGGIEENVEENLEVGSELALSPP